MNLRWLVLALSVVAALVGGWAVSLPAGPARADAPSGSDEQGNGPEQSPSSNDSETARLLQTTGRSVQWHLVGSVPLQFDTYHPQGMVHVGDRWFMTSVQILQQTQKCNPACGGFDRTPGQGIGHLFVYDSSGHLLNDVHLGHDTIYHPGGLDYDGHDLWIPVSEYRPHSQAIIYRVDPNTLKVTQAFTVNDHIGDLTRDQRTGHLVGGNWGARTTYEWTAEGQQIRKANNPDQYVDFQDCHYLAERKAVCGGISNLNGPSGPFELGGLSLVDLETLQELNAIPLLVTSPSTQHHVLTRNPIWLDTVNGQLRLTAVPDDDNASMLTYTAG